MKLHACEAVPADSKSECDALGYDIMSAVSRKVGDGADAILRLFVSVDYTEDSCSDTGSKGVDTGTDKQTNDTVITSISTAATDKPENGATAHVASYLSLTVLCFVTMLFL